MIARRPSFLVGLVVLALPACGKDDAAPPPEHKTPVVTAEPSPPARTGTTTGAGTSAADRGGSTTGADPFATDDWSDDDLDQAATVGVEATTTGADAEPRRFDGPCFVRWSKGGPILRFKYDADGGGGRLRIDGDNDGKADVCARFWTKDQRTHKVSVDEGCDRSTDALITPAYDDAINLATATWVDKRGDDETSQEITLITLPAFTGIAPGYPLYAARDDVKLKTSQGRVTRATVSTPLDGPPVKLSLRYDGDGRVTRIDEDHEADGKVDRRFDYRYDEVGNVTGMTLKETTTVDGKRTTTKKTATLGYGCWAAP